MTKNEALKMAVEEMYKAGMILAEALQSCKDALALSEKQHTFPDKKQPAQEPVAWMNDIAFSMDKELLGTRSRIVPLYTHPAPVWQGLSDDEREILYDKAIEMPLANLWNDYAYLIEQALKEKNT